MFIKLDNKSWQRQSLGTRDEAGHEGNAGPRRHMTNTPSSDCVGQSETGLNLL